MDIRTEWEDAGRTAIRITYGRGWSWEEFMAADQQVQALLNTLDRRADLILDLRGAVIPPSLASNLPELATRSALVHPNCGIVLVVGTDPFIHHLWEIFRGVYRQLARRVFLFAGLEEALAFHTSRRSGDAPPA